MNIRFLSAHEDPEPEYASVEAFAEYLMDDERVEFTARDLQKLGERLGKSNLWWRRELEAYGFRMAKRPAERIPEECIIE